MANNSRVSRSTSLEDLREKNNQLEAEVGKLAGEMQEVLKRQDESSKRQEESQRKMEETSRALDNKLSNLGLIMERTLRQISDKIPTRHCGETSHSNGNKDKGEGNSRNNINGIDEERMDPNCDLNSEEFHWTESNIRNRERMIRPDHRKGMQLPKMDFPHFDGSDPTMWQLNCEFYFDMYEVPEVYKSRMAVMHFSEEIHEWYRCLATGGHQMPWNLLVEEVMAQFKNHTLRNPVDEFKRIHQMGKVEEFIKKFDRVRARLLLEKPTLGEGFFVSGFISGLKEEIKHTVELFNPRGFNNTFQCTLKVEAALETHNRRPKEMSRNFKYQTPAHSPFNKKGENEKPGVKEG